MIKATLLAMGLLSVLACAEVPVPPPGLEVFGSVLRGGSVVDLPADVRASGFARLHKDLSAVLTSHPEEVLTILIDGLGAPEAALYHKAAYTLREVTGENHGFNTFGSATERVAAQGAWLTWIEEHRDRLDLALLPERSTLILDEIPGRIVGNDGEPPGRLLHLDAGGNNVVDIYSLKMPYDAALAADGTYFVSIIRAHAVYHVSPAGEVLSEISVGGYPTALSLLRSGNLLVSGWMDGEPGWVREFDLDGEIVWSLEHLKWPWKAQRLESGNTLIADAGTNRIYEVRPDGTETWALEGLGPEPTVLFDHLGPVYVQRLDDGNNLVSIRGESRIVELDMDGEVVWEVGPDVVLNPYSAERLWNGNTLISDGGHFRVIEVDLNGEIVWEMGGFGYPAKAYRLPVTQADGR